MSIGSACELETLVILAEDLGPLPADRAAEFMASIARVRGMLLSFRRRLRRSAIAPEKKTARRSP
ncbi:MAG TPA: hypothetical protein VF039_00710 [Longimicrobiales bacterium]